MEKRNFPSKVIITAGMPNGNKPLHIGHISVFIWSDFYARYMRDRIGSENVIYICGTDGFGSSTEEKYRKLKAEGGTDLTLTEYITNFNKIQKETLKKYDISLNRFYASCLQPALKYHTEISAFMFKKMLENGKLQKKQTEQFYDEKLNTFLNGRQVEGKCPIEGCQSEVGYADECSLGHQYSPRDLIEPKSTLSNTVPTFKKITNYYLSLDEYRENLMNIIYREKEKDRTHKFMIKEMRDYMTRPVIFITPDEKEKLEKLNLKQDYEIKFDEKKNRYELVFNNVKSRDIISDILSENKIHYTTNKTLAPLRITGNAAWGVPVPFVEEDAKDLTFYVWPESLWAPISFTKTYLEEMGISQTWQDWWCNKENEITQFIGEDNLYFYALAEPAIFMAVNGKENNDQPENGKLQMPNIVANKHVLLNNIKASSSGSLKAPTADNLLDYYTKEQLRCHFLSMNINNAAYNFKSKVFSPQDFEGTGDPVVAQGNMLTNIFNRLVRSVIYSCQTMFNNKIPTNKPDIKIIEKCKTIVEEYQNKVQNFKFNEVIILLDEFFRAANQDWSVRSKINDENERKQLIADTIHIIKVGTTLLHPIAPEGSALVAKYLKVDDKLWNWDNIEKTYLEICPDVDEFLFLEPKFDFFKKHPSQI